MPTDKAPSAPGAGPRAKTRPSARQTTPVGTPRRSVSAPSKTAARATKPGSVRAAARVPAKATKAPARKRSVAGPGPAGTTRGAGAKKAPATKAVARKSTVGRAARKPTPATARAATARRPTRATGTTTTTGVASGAGAGPGDALLLIRQGPTVCPPTARYGPDRPGPSTPLVPFPPRSGRPRWPDRETWRSGGRRGGQRVVQ